MTAQLHPLSPAVSPPSPAASSTAASVSPPSPTPDSSPAPGPGAQASARLFIGLMSGTSLDAVDGVLTRFDIDGRPEQTLASASRPITGALHDALTRLQHPADDDLEAAAAAGIDLAILYSQVVTDLLDHAGVGPEAVAAIGAHGQTVRHRPERGYTLQVLAPAVLAERAAIDVVADLRSADVAAGGEGAPLVPAFHQVIFAQPGAARAVVNIGGIANVTVLDGRGGVTGHDTGPGNTLLDAWIHRHQASAYDADGRWAASGTVDHALLERWLADPYFSRQPPKSTGRDLFEPHWLARLGGPGFSRVAPADVQATLLELTARTIVADLVRAGSASVFVCGGGALNGALMARLASLLAAALPGTTLATTDQLGIAPLAVEATAFAWLAMRRIDRLPGNLASVTGARGPRILGAVYPASRYPAPPYPAPLDPDSPPRGAGAGSGA